MTGPGYGEATINEATGFSGFGGHLLISDDRPDAAQAGATAESVEAASRSRGSGHGRRAAAGTGLDPGVREELEATIPGIQALVDRAVQVLPPDQCSW